MTKNIDFLVLGAVALSRLLEVLIVEDTIRLLLLGFMAYRIFDTPFMVEVLLQVDYACLQRKKAEKIQFIETAKDGYVFLVAHQRRKPGISFWFICHA